MYVVQTDCSLFGEILTTVTKLWIFLLKNSPFGNQSPLRAGEGGRGGYPALPILNEKQGYVFAIITHLPQKLLQGNKREREAHSNPRHSGVSDDTPKSDHDCQTWHCCCWQPEIPTHSVPALCHDMPFPSRWEKISPQQMTNIPQTGHCKKTTGTNKREGQATHPKT